MKKYIWTLASLLILISSNSAFACSCLAGLDVEDRYQASSAILAGTIIGKRESVIKPGYLEVKIAVKKWYKTEDPDSPIFKSEEITIFTPADEARCGITLEKDIDYLLYLLGSPAFYQTTLCTGTKNLDLAMEEIPALIKLNAQKPESEEKSANPLPLNN